jgi:hypothetical protein
MAHAIETGITSRTSAPCALRLRRTTATAKPPQPAAAPRRIRWCSPPREAMTGYAAINTAWLDSALYLRRSDDELTLTIEHRAAPSHGSTSIRLVANAVALALTAKPAPISSGQARADLVRRRLAPRRSRAHHGAVRHGRISAWAG